VDNYGAATGADARGTDDARWGGMTIVFIIGGVWLGGSVLLMSALALAAKRPTPQYESSEAELREAA
jgi:hypothetical protein